MNVRRALITAEREELADSIMHRLGNPSWPKKIAFSTDRTIIGLMHELSHCFVNFAAMFSTGDTLFEADINYAVYSEIEGELLEKAAFEPDSSNTKECSKRALVARDMKRRTMTERQRKYESDKEKCEDTAEYATYRILQLLKKGYEPGLLFFPLEIGSMKTQRQLSSTASFDFKTSHRI